MHNLLVTTSIDYSQVPNKQGSGNNGGGLQMVRYSNNWGGWDNRGGGILGKIENSRLLR